MEEEERKKIEQIKQKERSKATEEIDKFKELYKNIKQKEIEKKPIESNLKSIQGEIKNVNKDIFNEINENSKLKESKSNNKGLI